MTERVGRMISMEVGVGDAAAGKDVASVMMGEASPKPGTERAITAASVVKYLRAFEVPESADHTGPAVWVNFGITYDTNAEADSIAGWLVSTLQQTGTSVTLRVDTSEVALEIAAVTAVIRAKVKESA